MSDRQEEQDVQFLGKYTRVFRDLDTKSAIVASIVISVITISYNWFINLCSYLYWRSYFSQFKIPFKYINEAMISDNNMKFAVILMVPPVILLWLFLSSCLKKAKYIIIDKLKLPQKPVIKNDSIIIKLIEFIFALGVMVVLFMCGVIIADEWTWLELSETRSDVFLYFC